MVNSFLSFAATNEFEIYFLGIGPTDTNLFHRSQHGHYLSGSNPSVLETFVPIYAIVLTLGLVFVVWQSHKNLWALDMKTKRSKSEPNPKNTDQALTFATVLD